MIHLCTFATNMHGILVIYSTQETHMRDNLCKKRHHYQEKTPRRHQETTASVRYPPKVSKNGNDIKWIRLTRKSFQSRHQSKRAFGRGNHSRRQWRCEAGSQPPWNHACTDSSVERRDDSQTVTRAPHLPNTHVQIQLELESSRSLQVPPPRQSYSPGSVTIFALPAVRLCPL